MADFTYLLDTNILSNLIRDPAGSVAQRIAEKGEETVYTSIIVACELRFGSEKKQSASLQMRVEQLLAVLDVLPLDIDTDFHYAEIRVKLEAAGTPIGPNDLLIAAHARSLDLILVSANVREFSRVPGLSVENWLE
ncbi:PIN domain-containing protein [Desulfocastanea catecholica]